MSKVYEMHIQMAEASPEHLWYVGVINTIHDFSTKLGKVSAQLNAELQHAIKVMQQCDKLCSSVTWPDNNMIQIKAYISNSYDNWIH